jgi:hypothetical protein
VTKTRQHTQTVRIGGTPSWKASGVPRGLRRTPLVTLTSAEGAGERTHAGARGRVHLVMFDWLDATLAS